MKLKLLRPYGLPIKETYPKLFENFEVKEEKHCVWVQINSLNDLIKVTKSTNKPLIIEEFEKDGIPYLEGLIYDDWIE